MLYLRRVADAAGLGPELSPGRAAGGGWYRQVFSPRLAPVLAERLEAEAPHPLLDRKGKAPSSWTLGQLFRGAALFNDDELVAALAAAGEVELALRGELGLEALTVWITRSLVRRPTRVSRPRKSDANSLPRSRRARKRSLLGRFRDARGVAATAASAGGWRESAAPTQASVATLVRAPDARREQDGHYGALSPDPRS
jgi:hypothetical protein